MKAKSNEIIFTALVLIFCLIYLLMSLKLGPNARLIPMPLALLSLALCVLLIINTQDIHKEDKEHAANGKREINAILSLGILLMMVGFIGPAIGCGLFIFLYLTLKQRMLVIKALSISVVTSFMIYLILYRFLQLSPDFPFQMLL